jgi:DNA mismatch repair protein MutS2
VRALRQEAQDQLEGLVRLLDGQGYLRDRNFTIRNDRYVLPVKSEVQRLVEGIVHDASQTHQTVFVEPRALLEIGNRIKIARAQVMEEEERVLRDLSAELGDRADEIAADLQLTGTLEATFARGAFAKLTHGEKPRLEGEALDLKEARHPLLAYYRELKVLAGESPAALVDNDIALGAARVLVISGPNGGGKTVALTTAGLIAVLVRAGVPVPVSPHSRVPLYGQVVCAMAGDQSLAAGLSTFQWHLVELKRALEEADKAATGPTLVLVDEICSGTDPAEGTALAQAVLEQLARTSRVIVTTHFERLKVLAVDPAKGGVFRNASFALSEKTGRPTFRLLLDQAGTSRALAAARDKGLPASVLARAEELLSPDDKELQSALRHLSEQADSSRARLAELEAEHQTVAAERERLARKLEEVEREARRLRTEGKRAFLDELADARRAVAEAIEAAKGGAPAKDLDQQMKKLLDAERGTQADVQAASAPSPLVPRQVSVGDVVEIASMPGTRMSVVEVDGDDVVVAKGAVKTRTKVSALRVPGSDKEKKESPWKRAPTKPPSAAVEPRTKDNSLDVRGKRTDEALEMVDAFLDRMMKEDKARAFILHGHGGGSLKGAIRKALGQSRYVARHQPADLEDGGDAWTVVTLSS